MTENMKKLLDLVAGGGKCICSFGGAERPAREKKPAPASWAAAENTPTAASSVFASSAETVTGNRFSNE